jgi:hypothetical protein
MKTLLLLFLASFIPLLADDLVQNGDFSDGLTHWFGDVRAISDVDAFAASQSSSGIALVLHEHDWAKARQTLRLPAGTYKLHVTLTPSSELHLSDQYADYINFPQKLEFTGGYYADASTGEWVAAVRDSEGNGLKTWTTNLTKPTGQQSYTFTFQISPDSREQDLYIAFPPGSGYVILQHVAMIPQ